MEGDFRLGEWLVSPALNQISTNGKSTRVEPKAMQVLLQLAQAEGVVNKDRLISAVWPDVFVTNDVLPGCIAALRRAFEDNAREPKVIETIPKSGYHLLPPVEWCNGNRSAAAELQIVRPEKRNHKWLVAGAIAGGLLLFALLGWRFAFPRRYDSVAILPLVNASGDPQAQFLSDGIAESVIDDLSQAGSLKVMAWTTVSHYRSTQPDVRTLGRQLAVTAALTGRLLRVGDRLVVQAELVDVQNGRQLWGKQYDSPMNNLLGLQEELARDIATNLRVSLTGPEEKKIVSHYTGSPTAYQLYLKGRFFWNRRNRDGLQTAIEYFEQAIKTDPKYAPAYAGLADSYNLLDDWGETPPRDSFPKARAAADKAISLEPSLAEAHVSLAMVRESYDWDWVGAEQEFKHAIELNPNYPTAHQWYGLMLATLGRFPEAEAEVKRAQQLDPLSPIINMAVAEVYTWERRYDLATEQYTKVIALDPTFAGAYGNIAEVYRRKHLYRDALNAIQHKWELSGNPAFARSLERAYSESGYSGVIREELKEVLEERARGQYADAIGIAGCYAELGDESDAFRWLEKGYEEHSSGMQFLGVGSDFDSLRSSTQFQYWLNVVGLPSIAIPSSNDPNR